MPMHNWRADKGHTVGMWLGQEVWESLLKEEWGLSSGRKGLERGKRCVGGAWEEQHVQRLCGKSAYSSYSPPLLSFLQWLLPSGGVPSFSFLPRTTHFSRVRPNSQSSMTRSSPLESTKPHFCPFLLGLSLEQDRKLQAAYCDEKMIKPGGSHRVPVLPPWLVKSPKCTHLAVLTYCFYGRKGTMLTQPVFTSVVVPHSTAEETEAHEDQVNRHLSYNRSEWVAL